MKNLILTMIAVGFTLVACSHANCGAEKKPHESGVVMTNTSSADRVKVYKFDGSLQCGQGKKIDLSEMQKELKTIKVYSSVNKSDGMMHIQLCGSPTGNCNVYEIDRKDLDEALKAGFKQWTGE